MNIENRYSRQVSLKGFGEEAQQSLFRGKVLVIGAGGLGCPALQYLAAAGVGTIGIVDGDVVSLSNLHRQVLYSEDDIGKLKAEQAVVALKKLNPDCNFRAYAVFLDQSNALNLIAQYDVIIDGTDNFSSRYLVNDACVLLGKPLIYGSVSRFEGQVSVFNYKGGINYRNLFPNPPAAGEIPDCREAGVLGVLPGIIGALQAAEAIKLLAGIGNSLQNRLLTYNLLKQEWMEFELKPDPAAELLLPRSEEEFLNRDYSERSSFCSSDLQELEGEEFDRFIKNETCTVIDVREYGEAPLVNDFDHIQIPMSELADQAQDYHHQTIVLFCHSGVRSVAAADYFPGDNRLYHLKGGLVKWMYDKLKRGV